MAFMGWIIRKMTSIRRLSWRIKKDTELVAEALKNESLIN